MISGTIVIEDHAITFRAKSDKVIYTVCDALTGKEETKTVAGKGFMLALGIALNCSGDVADKEDYELAEDVMPDNKELRFIP